MTTAPYYSADGVTLWLGDSLDVLPTLPDASVDAVVTDPPYELGFMGRAWDASGIAYSVPLWRECLRVLRPGGHLVAFGGTRTYHRLAAAIEDAGFEVRDSLHWIYGSGFPKSLDVSKAIDKAAGAQREVVGHGRSGATLKLGGANGRPWHEEHAANGGVYDVTAPATTDAARWQGWGTALKPAHEPIVLARKPLAGTVAATVLAHGTGALNIDATRVGAAESLVRPSVVRTDNTVFGSGLGAGTQDEPAGRWPSNVILTHPPLVDEHGDVVGDACADGCVDGCVDGCPVAELDRQSGVTRSRTGGRSTKALGVMNDDAWQAQDLPRTGHDDQGGASRFFPVFRYEAKASKRERPRLPDGTAHPTVKPLALMRWLVRLITPPGGTVLDPFTGTGPTLEAARLEGFTGIGIEREQPHAELCRIRLDKPRDLPRTPKQTRTRARAIRPAPEQDALFDEIA